MIKTSKWEVALFEAANRGMRNPMNSWSDSDSYIQYIAEVLSGKDIQTNEPKNITITKEKFVYGPKDLKLAKSLASAGAPSHRKYLRQIIIAVDIDAPLYWWKEMDTYKVGTVANSCSTMHTIHKTPITKDLFSTDYLDSNSLDIFNKYLDEIEFLRLRYITDHKKETWNQIIQMLPSSFNQKRTVVLNYEILTNIINDRSNHKLNEWHTFINDAIKSCPYVKELILEPINKHKEMIEHANEHDKLVNIINAYKAKYGELTQEDIDKVKDSNTKQEVKNEDINNKVVAIRGAI